MNETKVKKASKALERLQYIALFIASLLLITGIDLVTGDMGWQKITDPYFYVSNLLTDASMLCVTFGTVYAYLDFFKENNEEYLGYMRNISEFSKGKENIPSVLSKFLDYINRNRKKVQFKYNVRMKLYRLENARALFWLFRPKKLKFSEEEIHIWNFGTEEQKQKSLYCRKRKIYEDQLNEEFIENNIDSMSVKYDRITPDVLFSEYFANGEKGKANQFVTKNENMQIVRYRVPRLLFSFAITFLIASVVLGGMEFNTGALVKIVANLFVLIWNTYTSYRYAKKHSDRVTLKDARFRNSIIEEYRKWLAQQAQ